MDNENIIQNIKKLKLFYENEINNIDKNINRDNFIDNLNKNNYFDIYTNNYLINFIYKDEQILTNNEIINKLEEILFNLEIKDNCNFLYNLQENNNIDIDDKYIQEFQKIRMTVTRKTLAKKKDLKEFREMLKKEKQSKKNNNIDNNNNNNNDNNNNNNNKNIKKSATTLNNNNNNNKFQAGRGSGLLKREDRNQTNYDNNI